MTEHESCVEKRGKLQPGDAFGDLTVVALSDERRGKDRLWLCRCVCGEECLRTNTQLRRAKNVCRKKRVDDLTGRIFGYLAVEELLDERESHYALYRCRCSCGRTVKVSSKNLKRGAATCCDKCRDMKVFSSGGAHPAVQPGQTFGDLMVVRRLAGADAPGKGCTWLCRCVCGAELMQTTKQLRQNRNACRGNHSEKSRFVDLTGRTINQLTVEEKLDSRDKKGSVMWRCRCSCGEECTYSADALLHGQIVSCGCYRRQMNASETMQSGLHHVDGTCVEFLRRKKRADNTSGHTGVYRTQNGKWKAGITLQGKRYDLGTYEKKRDAIRARRQGEELHGKFLEAYYREHPETAGKRRSVRKP